MLEYFDVLVQNFNASVEFLGLIYHTKMQALSGMVMSRFAEKDAEQ